MSIVFFLLLHQGLYLTAVMAMTSVSVMMTVFVLNLHYRGPKKNELPFWLQQMLSLSLANTMRSLGRSRKTKNRSKSREIKPRRRSSREIIRKSRSPTIRTPANGLVSSYSNVNEVKVKTRVTTDVSRLSSSLVGK